MLRILTIFLLFYFSCTVSGARITGTWNGHSDYLPEDTAGGKLPRQKLDKALVMLLNSNGLVNGTLRVHYGRSKNPNFVDPQYNFLGRFDAATKKMVR